MFVIIHAIVQGWTGSTVGTVLNRTGFSGDCFS